MRLESQTTIWNPESAVFFQGILKESGIQNMPIFLADCHHFYLKVLFLKKLDNDINCK